MPHEPAPGRLPPPLEDLLVEDLLALVAGTDRARDLLSRHGIRGIQTLSQAEVAAEGLPEQVRQKEASVSKQFVVIEGGIRDHLGDIRCDHPTRASGLLAV